MLKVKKIVTLAVVNGPNLNQLKSRESEHYGRKSLHEIESDLKTKFKPEANLIFFQSNHEGSLIDFVQDALDIDGIVINPGALTHTSIALRDCLIAKKLPVIEVHLSNILAREEFRRKSYISDIAVGVISGFKDQSYHFGVRAMIDYLQK